MHLSETVSLKLEYNERCKHYKGTDQDMQLWLILLDYGPHDPSSLPMLVRADGNNSLAMSAIASHS